MHWQGTHIGLRYDRKQYVHVMSETAGFIICPEFSCNLRVLGDKVVVSWYKSKINEDIEQGQKET